MDDSANNKNDTPASSFCVDSAEQERSKEEQELYELVVPAIRDLPLTPPSALEANFACYFAADFMKPAHDQYIYRHANGLCVIGLAPTHVALKEKGVTAVDFNVGKSNRSEIKVTGKRKKRRNRRKDITIVVNSENGLCGRMIPRHFAYDIFTDVALELGVGMFSSNISSCSKLGGCNAQHFEANTALCKVCTSDASYIVRCCVKGSLLEVNDRLIDQPGLLNSSADREGYIAIIMPRPADWLKSKSSLLSLEDYKKLRDIS